MLFYLQIPQIKGGNILKRVNYEKLVNELLDHSTEGYGAVATLELLKNMGYSKEDAIELGFDLEDINEVYIDTISTLIREFREDLDTATKKLEAYLNKVGNPDLSPQKMYILESYLNNTIKRFQFYLDPIYKEGK